MSLSSIFVPVLFLFIFFGSFAQHSAVSTAPVPSWTKKIEPDFKATQPAEESTGFYYLLVDNQDNLETEESYRRYSYKILNATGIQDMSDISIDFDPEYQKLKLHHIRIIRNGKIHNNLNLQELQVVQREANMERKLYDGRLTAIANLRDVRVDDIIDYSFTISGSNPVHKGKYQNSFYLQFQLPIHEHHYSIFVPQGESIRYKTFNEAAEPQISTSTTGTTYSWKSKELKPVVYESNVPAWYGPEAFVDVTQFETWKEVIDQYNEFYTLSSEENKRLQKRIEKLLSTSEKESEFVDLAVRFVQDEVRYLGFENGLNSHKPSNPLEVLERRYGDCKDKSFLLSEILKSQGLEASPMLVHSYDGRNLSQSLPSAIQFDHCVVQVSLKDGTQKYIDPTINGQGGTLENIFFPNYEYGLVLNPGEKKLTRLPESLKPKTSITETFELDEVGGGAKLDVETIYRGSSADFQRREFAASSQQTIQQGYTSFYSNLYPSITAEKNVSFRDYRDRNEFVVYEQYRIDSLWVDSAEQQELIFAEFYPLVLRDFLFPEKATDRKMPYYIDPTTNISHKTVVFTPEEWSVQNEDFSFGNEDFKYDFGINYSGKKLEITHKYASLNDHITPENMSAYLAEHKEAQQHTSYSLTYNKNFAGLAGSASTSWMAVFFTLLAMAATAFFCYRIYVNYDIPTNIRPEHQRKIGGWLVLVAIGLCLTPLIVLTEFLGTSEFFQSSIWRAFFSSTDTIAAGLLFFIELVYNSAYFIFSIFVLVIFFQRRSIAPKMIIWYFAVTLVFPVLDTFASLQLFSDGFTGAEKQEMYMELIKLTIRSAIWIPYFIYSERVKETFTKTRSSSNISQNEEIPEEPAAVLTP